MESYLYFKAIHIIGVVSWFAGLFYIVRLFIYHTEAQQRPSPEKEILIEQFRKMERLLWNVITTPAMVLTVLMGFSMLYLVPNLLQEPWLQAKLTFVVLLLGYHFYCQHLLRKLRGGSIAWTSIQLRLWNEVATILLVAIVFLVVLKTTLGWLEGIAGLFIFGIVLMLTVRLAKYIRHKTYK